MKLNPGGNAKLVSMGKSLQEEMKALLGPDGVLLYPSHPTVAPRHNSPICMPFNFAYTGEQLQPLCWVQAGLQHTSSLLQHGMLCCSSQSVSIPDSGCCSTERCFAAPEHGARIMLMLYSSVAFVAAVAVGQVQLMSDLEVRVYPAQKDGLTLLELLSLAATWELLDMHLLECSLGLSVWLSCH